MNTKKVCAIVLILLGAAFVFKGVNGYSAASAYGGEIQSLKTPVNNNADNSADKALKMQHSHNTLINDKATQILVLVFGLMGAIMGTALLMREKSKKLEYDFGDHFDMESINHRWKM